ncbi:unnamed protein product [Soboliphyme baturini]|uniref:Lipid_DES domain-containing protein n=1 Tax=Soboliphyme baturini TaxID=241478 RepID=A0A183IA20_9BILA|nr:unnamed protein product [Soboliphyme baturini]
MGAHVTRHDFDWSYTEEPHATRRNIILKKHPEIKDLFCLDQAFKYVVTAMVVTQIIACYCLKDSCWLLILIQAYCSGGVFNHALELAVHEVSHNAAFGNGHPFKARCSMLTNQLTNYYFEFQNRFFGIFANLPIGIPFSVSFKKYHLEHHRYLGEEGLDTDIPTELEARLFNTTFRKFVWLVFQAFFYAFRPLIIYRKSLSDFEILNMIVQFTFDYCIYYYFGGKAIAYLLLSSFLSMGVHPTAGHFIAEHYVFKPWQDTYSYYGPLNMVTFNVGYHVEHHDFPFISGNRLPEVSSSTDDNIF